MGSFAIDCSAAKIAHCPQCSESDQRGATMKDEMSSVRFLAEVALRRTGRLERKSDLKSALRQSAGMSAEGNPRKDKKTRGRR